MAEHEADQRTDHGYSADEYLSLTKKTHPAKQDFRVRIL